ncbi:MAG TPA: hypothetical protein VFZ22_08165 [Pyrinomonadaceae bacterium]|nr:hypothetical protein [Pyrinomonadaceae bacterium]
MLKTPVAVLIFNRPETTKRILSSVFQARPEKLFVIADGPRTDTDDQGKCEAARSCVDDFDWQCDVVKNYSESNLGCGLRPASGIDWLFQQVDRAIILEDDCLPEPSFFRFCEELLDRYRDEHRVAMISGNNFQLGKRRSEYSYYFSRYTHIWGWATWKRAWQNYDFQMREWQKLRETRWLEDVLQNHSAATFWQNTFDNVGNMRSVWDYQWAFTCWLHDQVAVLPQVNLVSNIGWGEAATHTKDPNNPAAFLATFAMDFPLRHPSAITIDREADNFTFATQFADRPATPFARLRWRLSRAIRGDHTF